MKQSVERSAELFKSTWGENVVVRFSLGLVMFLFGLVGYVPVVLVRVTNSEIAIMPVVILEIAYWLILGVFCSALNGIFATALYKYISTGTLPVGFNPKVIMGTLEPTAAKGP